MILSHLSTARRWSINLSMYRRNVTTVLEDVVMDDLLLDMFRTEYHLLFLWGSKGASVTSAERYDKFKQVLNLMSQTTEP